jgi:hypothetical protein
MPGPTKINRYCCLPATSINDSKQAACQGDYGGVTSSRERGNSHPVPVGKPAPIHPAVSPKESATEPGGANAIIPVKAAPVPMADPNRDIPMPGDTMDDSDIYYQVRVSFTRSSSRTNRQVRQGR